jgi:hypothetical protein
MDGRIEGVSLILGCNGMSGMSGVSKGDGCEIEETLGEMAGVMWGEQITVVLFGACLTGFIRFSREDVEERLRFLCSSAS